MKLRLRFQRLVKEALTRLGAGMSREALLQAEASMNYVRVGHWIREMGYCVAERMSSREEVWSTVATMVRSRKVLYLEFGVASGESMRFWSSALKNSESSLHGFDSFEGLPEGGGPWTKGQFDAQGRPPAIADPRVKFFKGWFEDVLPRYDLPARDVLIINMDADLYSSTKFVLSFLQRHIARGTYLYFDEWNHVEHEPRAFSEFLITSGRQFRIVAADRTLAHVFFECIA